MRQDCEAILQTAVAAYAELLQTDRYSLCVVRFWINAQALCLMLETATALIEGGSGKKYQPASSSRSSA